VYEKCISFVQNFERGRTASIALRASLYFHHLNAGKQNLPSSGQM
jgi:hypothetical protein